MITSDLPIVVNWLADDEGLEAEVTSPEAAPVAEGGRHWTGARVLAIEAGATVVLDREAVIRRSNRHGIALVGLAPAGPTDRSGADE